MPRLKKYRVTMWSPLYSCVTAKNKDDAINKADDGQDWEAPVGQGFEKYDVEVIRKEKKK